MTERPDFCDDDMLEYMDQVRSNGHINPLAAGPDLQQMFGLSRYEASNIIKYWIHSFNDRLKAGEVYEN